MKYNAVTVTQLNKYLKDRFDEDENLNAILVKGEISNFKNFVTKYRGAIIGIIIAILILCTRIYELILAIVLLFIGAIAGNYVQQNKYDVKEKLKNFIDRL